MLRISCLITIAILQTCLAIEQLSAQPRKELFGEVPIESTDTKKNDSYLTQQNQALEYTRLVSKISSKQSNEISALNLSENAAFYFTGLYLYCSAKAGACPFILDTILSAEYFKNKGRDKKECRDMKSVWELWVKNSFEQRLSYLVPIGSSTALKNFNAQARSYYIKCEETLLSFKPDLKTEKSIALTLKLIEQVQSKRINVFEETGAFKAK